jgi:hypothetical protein
VSRTTYDADSIKLRIAELQLEHRGLNQMIERMAQEPDTDQLLVRRLKKRKLQIKDSIVLLQMQADPRRAGLIALHTAGGGVFIVPYGRGGRGIS